MLFSEPCPPKKGVHSKKIALVQDFNLYISKPMRSEKQMGEHYTISTYFNGLTAANSYFVCRRFFDIYEPVLPTLVISKVPNCRF